MKDKLSSGKARMYIMLITFVAVLLFVGILMEYKMQSLLHDYIEKQVTGQAMTLAEVLEKQIDAELLDLENIAGYIESEPEDIEKHINMAREKDSVAEWGLLELGGDAVYGKGLNTADYSGIKNSFRGNKAVSYKHEDGLLFTVPVYNSGNIKYVLYKFFEADILMDKFGRTCYEGEGRVLIANSEEQIVVPYVDWNEEDISFLKSESIKNIFEQIRERMNISSAASVYYDDGDDSQYVFVSEVGDYSLLLVGVIDESIVAEGFSYIVTLVLWVFGLLLLLLAIGLMFLFGAEEKAKESEELRHAKMMADTANKAKSDFLANMSHEIRTPINAVMGMNEMIIRECEDDTIRGYAVNIQNASNTLLSLINDILDLSKIEAGKMEIVNDYYQLSTLLNDVVNMMQIKASKKDIAFDVQVDKEIYNELCGDEVRIRQVMVNILSNAVKYTKEGSVNLKVSKEMQDKENVWLKIAVRDTGVGIKQEDMEKLFGKFERLNLKENRNVEGTGLGLAITNKIVALMNGRMEVESEYGVGSTFTVYLPQQIAGDEFIGDFEEKYHKYIQSLHQYKESFTAPDAHILVVDDNEMNLFVVQNLLKKTMIKITCCSSGDKCLKLVKQNSYDVIFLDHMMPGMDGIETLRELKAMENGRYSNIPVIALTANAIVGAYENYIAEGFDDYLSKPIYGEKLEEMLRNYIPKDKLISAEQEKCEPEVVIVKEQYEYIDVSTGMQYSAENEMMFREFLKMFCDMKTERKQAIEEAYNKEDWDNYRILVHSLKSTSLSVGCCKLSEGARLLEMAAKENNISYIKDNHSKVMKLYDDTLNEGVGILNEHK